MVLLSKAFYSVDQVAEILKLHQRTIRRYIRGGKLKATKVGKEWRITQQDLNLFTNQNSSLINSSEPVASVSAVIDIDVSDMNEAMRYANTLTALLNSKPAEYGRTSFSAQFLEHELKVRLMLWGNLQFMSIMINTIETLMEN